MEQDLQHLIQETVHSVEKFWNEHEQPLLLSALGNLEGGRISRNARRHASGLRQFLGTFVSDQLMVVQHSRNRPIVGVVPITEQTQKIFDWDSLLEKTSSSTSMLRLHPALWAAFNKPIDSSLERYVQISDPVRFDDIRRDDAPQDGIHIEQQYIVGPGARAEEIYEKAVQWITKNNLNLSDFLHKPLSTGDNKLPTNDLLGKLVLALDSHELQRTSIPMDVVAKLRRQAV